MKASLRLYISTLLALVFLLSCHTIKVKDQIVTIAVSKERSKEHQYGSWLSATGLKTNIVNLSGLTLQQVIDTLDHCDALLLSGGADVHPSMYGKSSDTTRCGFIDIERDKYELAAYKKARSSGMPVLGICRGLQYINIMEGGTLYVDLPSDRNSGDLHRIGEEDWSEHAVKIVAGSLLDKINPENHALVASNHHQGIEMVAPTLKVSARSEDGLVEAIETSIHDGRFLLAVQWHPEWVSYDDVFSKAIALLYLEAAQDFKEKRR